MGALEFTSKLIASLVWPLVAVGVMWFLRNEVKDLAGALVKRMKDLKKLSAGAVSAEFDRGATQVAEKTDAIAESVEESAPSTRAELPELVEGTDAHDQQAKLDRLLEQDPRAVVLLEFIEVESALTKMYEAKYGRDSRRTTGFIRMTNLLVRDGALDPALGEALKDLAALRNQLSHQPEMTVSASSARNFAEAASTSAELLEREAARLLEARRGPDAKEP